VQIRTGGAAISGLSRKHPSDCLGRSNWSIQPMTTAPTNRCKRGLHRALSRRTWQRSLISFLQQEGFSYTSSLWNPDAWIGGLLVDDRGTLDQSKMKLLRSTQAPPLGEPLAGAP